MADEKPGLDARFAEELTPLPTLGPTPSPLEADLAVAVATCNQLRLANATLQAELDEVRRLLNESRADRRLLAAQVKALQRLVKDPKEKAP